MLRMTIYLLIISKFSQICCYKGRCLFSSLIICTMGTLAMKTVRPCSVLITAPWHTVALSQSQYVLTAATDFLNFISFLTLNFRALFVCLYSWRYSPLLLYFHSPVAGFSLLVFSRFLDHTQRRITVGRTPLDE